MRILKKILKFTFITLGVIILLLFTLPFVFKGKIIARVKKEINKNLNAKVDFEDVNISFFRSFPKVSVALENILVTGNDVFVADTLLQAPRLDASVDIMSIIKAKDMTVYSVALESPRINLIRLKEGFANWDIVKTKEEIAKIEKVDDSKTFSLELQKYSVSNAYIRFDNASAGMNAVIDSLNHEGKGDFTADVFTLSTRTNAASVSFTNGNIPFLADAKTMVDADIKVDNKNSTYSFSNGNISLNELKVTGDGAIRSVPAGMDMDIKFKAPSTEFKNILSLVPLIYQQDFQKIKAGGSGIFEGFVKGIYNDSTMPAYHLAMEVKDGSFQYTDLPKPVKDINFKAQVDNKDGQPDNLVVNVQDGHLVMDNDPFDFRVLVNHPISNMYVDAGAKGKIDLSKVSGFLKLDKGTKLAGLINADVAMKGNVNDMEAQRYEQFDASGTVDVNDFIYITPDYPTGIRITRAMSAFTPSKIDVSTLSGQYMGTNFNGNGSINNLLSYVLNGKPLRANLNINADQLNLDDWMGTTSAATTTGATKPATTASSTSAFVVPANLNVSLNTKVGKLKYDKLDLQNLDGNLQLNDQAVIFNNVKANALDGTMKINGSYSTKDSKTKPAIALSYDVAGLDIQKTFYALNTAEKLMPIGKYLSGKLTSVLSANGKLGENMMPDISSLSGNGNVFLIEGFLSKFAPLDKIASVLNVQALQNISLKDVKTFFQFSNGKLLVKPFTLKVKDISMEIGGLQGFDQTMDYVIHMKLPRALMGSQGNNLVNNLAAAVNKKGIPLKVGETVNLSLKLGGTFSSPTIKVDLKQTGEDLADQLKEQVKDFVQAKIDSAKQTVKDTLTNIRERLLQQAKEELAKKIRQQKDTATVKDTGTAPKPVQPKPIESVKGILDGFLKKKNKPVADTGKKD